MQSWQVQVTSTWRSCLPVGAGHAGQGGALLALLPASAAAMWGALGSSTVVQRSSTVVQRSSTQQATGIKSKLARCRAAQQRWARLQHPAHGVTQFYRAAGQQLRQPLL